MGAGGHAPRDSMGAWELTKLYIDLESSQYNMLKGIGEARSALDQIILDSIAPNA
jgi:hypothetical protein